MIPAIRDSSPPGQALGIPSRSQERTHPTALWPAGLRSQRKTRDQRVHTGLFLPHTPYLTGCDSCAAEVTAPAFLHYPQPVGRATVKSSAREGGSAAVSNVHSTSANRNAPQVFHPRFCRPPAGRRVHQPHSSVCTAAQIPSAAVLIDPLGSALVSLWVYQNNQHDARIVQEGKRKAMRPSFWERASMTRRGGSVIAAGCALI